ncbi:MAG: hypothetical protein GXY39_07145 [Actinomycetales bacterium]|nr:hypothetical protein [Actinomycetales bacterium]
MPATQPHLTSLQLQQSEGMRDWRALGWGAAAWFEAPSHRAGAALVRKVAELAEEAGVPLPDLDLRASGLQVRLLRTEEGYEAGTVTFARAISAAAAELGLTADPAAVQDVQLAFDALERDAVLPFWASVLGYERVGEDDLVDPARRHPAIWFQEQDVPRPLRNRLHLDSVTTQPAAVASLEAARSLGAASVAEHGYYATVADAEGNEVDILPLPEGADRWPEPETEDWRLVFAAVAAYPTHSSAQAVEVAEIVAGLADEAGLPLGVDLRPGLVMIDSGKDRWEMDEGYQPLAARIQEAVRGLGLTADPTRARFVQVGIDAVDIPGARAFWRAVLGYDEDPRNGVTDIVDPRQLNMTLFFQNLDPSDTERRAQRNRIHVDVFVPDDQAQARIAAAVAAGGTVVRDASPEGWTIADPEGNEVDVAVFVGREELWLAEQSG